MPYCDVSYGVSTNTISERTLAKLQEIYRTLFGGRNGTEMDWFWVQMKSGREGSVDYSMQSVRQTGTGQLLPLMWC